MSAPSRSSSRARPSDAVAGDAAVSLDAAGIADEPELEGDGVIAGDPDERRGPTRPRSRDECRDVAGPPGSLVLRADQRKEVVRRRVSGP